MHILHKIITIVALSKVVYAHSWADCVDWRPRNVTKTIPFAASDGDCYGWARKFPYKSGVKFAYLDEASPNRHYDQGDPNDNSKWKGSPSCSDGVHGKEPGSDESMQKPISLAYAGNWGSMTRKAAGDTMCIRWPANNHAVKSEKEWFVRIGLSEVNPTSDPPQDFFSNPSNIIATLPFKNCVPVDTSVADYNKVQPCGGCFTLPKTLAPGMYVMQWRWRLNTPAEWYTSCWDMQVISGVYKQPYNNSTTSSSKYISPTSVPRISSARLSKIKARSITILLSSWAVMIFL